MLPMRSSPVPRDPRHVVVQVRAPKAGLSFVALAARVTADEIALATFVDLEAGLAVILDVEAGDGDPPLQVRGTVSLPRDDEGTVLVSLDAVDDAARERLSLLALPESGTTRAAQVA